MEKEIILVTKEELSNIIETRKPFGLFLCAQAEGFAACDNKRGDAFVENFTNDIAAEYWLLDKYCSTEEAEIYAEVLSHQKASIEKILDSLETFVRETYGEKLFGKDGLLEDDKQFFVCGLKKEMK